MAVFIRGCSYWTPTVGPYDLLASMGTVVVTPPAIEPLTLAEAKEQCRIDPANTTYDSKIRRYIKQARQLLEERTQRAFISRTLDVTADAFPSGGYLLLPMPPLVSVTSVTTYDEDDAATVMSTSDYRVDIDGVYGRLALTTDASWPYDLRGSQSVKIRYITGYGTTADTVPEPIRGAMDLLVGLYHEQHEAASITPGAGAIELPFGVTYAIETYKVL